MCKEFVIKELLKQKSEWEIYLRTILNQRNNPFFKKSHWLSGMEKEDFNDSVTECTQNLNRISLEIEKLI